MKKAVSLIISIIYCTFILKPFAFAETVTHPESPAVPEVSARAAVIISADTGEIIFSKNPNQKLPMASTTKIMSTLLLLESGGLDVQFSVDNEAIKVEGSSMGLREGDIVTKHALACGMMLPSGNDAANAAAVLLGGSLEGFAVMMNERAAKIGMTRSCFVTPSGLDAKGHGSSAYDMALLTREALGNELFRDICCEKSVQVSFGNPPYDRWLKNTNKLLNMYDGVYGVKTGFTDEAGRCLVSACERGGKNFIAVTLNAPKDWDDHIAMYDYAFEVTDSIEYRLIETLTANLAGGFEDFITLVPAEKIMICTACKDLSEFSYKVKVSPFVYAPVAKGDTVGELAIYYKDRPAMSIPLVAGESQEFKPCR